MKFSFYIYIICVFLISCSKLEYKPKPNILLICIDDLRPELKSFGAFYIISPNIDSLAQKGIAFKNHYVNAPSCGSSRYTLLTGLYGTPYNDALFQRSKKIKDSLAVKPSMPEWFKQNGYTTVSVGKVSHHPGGRGGKDWNDSTRLEIPNAWDKHLMPSGIWKHPRGSMHGLANGEIRNNPNKMDVFQSKEGVDVKYPDDLITDEALNQLKNLSKDTKQPFFLAVGIIKPHLPFGAPKKYYNLYKNVELPIINNSEKPNHKSTWHKSSEFMKYNRWKKNPIIDTVFAEEVRKHYAACVTYADNQVGKILHQLKQTGADENTIVVLWGDHGWHLGEHAIWGKHSLFEESLHAPLIIYDPRQKSYTGNVNDIVEAIDVFPTLCDLTGVSVPQFVQGNSLKKIWDLEKPVQKSALAYTSKAKTIRNKTHRLILHNDGYIELYSHITNDNETVNIAKQNPDIVLELLEILKQRLDYKI